MRTNARLRNVWLILCVFRRRVRREAKGKGRSFTWLAGHFDHARVMLDDAVDHGQTETGSFLAFGGEKRLKTISAHFLGHAKAGVADFKEDKFAFYASSQRQGTALRHGVYGVENQVGDGITQPASVPKDDWTSWELTTTRIWLPAPKACVSHFGLVNETACSINQLKLIC